MVGGEHSIPGSWKIVLDRLAFGLHIEYGAVVSHVDWSVANVADEGGRVPPPGLPPITVALANGDARPFDRVVCTLPLGVLQAMPGLFYPPLPESQTSALAQLRMGSLNKVVLQWATPFWKSVGPFLYFVNRNASNPWATFQDMKWFTGSAALTASMSGEFSRVLALEGWTDQAIVLDAMQVIWASFPAAPWPEWYGVTRWNADPYSRGSAPYPSVGWQPQSINAVTQPLGRQQRVLFAGDHTSAAALGTVHGAFQSGLDAANAAVAGYQPVSSLKLGLQSPAAPLSLSLCTVMAALAALFL